MVLFFKEMSLCMASKYAISIMFKRIYQCPVWNYRPFFISILVSFLFHLPYGFVYGHQVKSDTAVAKYNDRLIYEHDLDHTKIYPAQQKLYELKLDRLHAIVGEKLLALKAKELGIPVSKIFESEVDVPAVQDSEVEEEIALIFDTINQQPEFRNLDSESQWGKIFEVMGIDLDPQQDFEDQLKTAIRVRIASQKELSAEREYIMKLHSQFHVETYLEEPDSPVYDISLEGFPMQGSPDAPVTIVEFSDFECAYCSQLSVVINQLLVIFENKLKVVFRHFPLPVHRHAPKAHEAAECARAQGKFWEYRNLLFENFDKLKKEDLISYAQKLGLDLEKFRRDLDSGKFAAKIHQDIREGRRLGVNSTPSIFVNSRPIKLRSRDHFSELSRRITLELQGQQSGQIVRDDSGKRIYAKFEGGMVTEDDFDDDFFYSEAKQIYDLKIKQIREIFKPVVLQEAAKNAGTGIDSLFLRTIDATPSDVQVEEQFDLLNSTMLKNPRLALLPDETRKNEILRMMKIDPIEGKTFRELLWPVAERIARNKKFENEREQFIDELVDEAEIEIYFDPPEVPIYNLSNEGLPTIGAPNAPFTIVVFSDFQCPYSAQAGRVLNRLLANYSEAVRLVFRHFPLPFHEHAQKAHEASECAREQGKFWEYHDILYTKQDALEPDHMKQYATDLGLNSARFNRCLDTGKYASKIKEDIKQASILNVRGTPAFYINGKLADVWEYEEFEWFITDKQKGGLTHSPKIVSPECCR